MDQHASSDPSPGGGSWLHVLAISALLLLAVGCVFGKTVGYEFINLDDNTGVYENRPVMEGLTWPSIQWAFTSNLVGNWCPLTWMSHMAVWQCYGSDAGVHHLVNVLLHAATVVLLFLVLRQMTAALWPSALAAALWAIHPLRVESVVWVTERKDVLSGLFFMLTIWAYVGYTRRLSWQGRGLQYLAVLVFFALGLLSKPMLVTLPCVLLLLDYWPLKRLGWPWSGTVVAWRIVEKIPLVAMVGASCAVAVWAERVAEYPNRGLWWQIGNTLLSYVVYLRQFFWPTDLALLYPCPGPEVPLWPVLGAGLILLAITAAAAVLWRKCPYLLVGWLWFLGMLVPVIGIVPFGHEGAADRFTYLPQIGLCMAVAWGAAAWCGSLPVRRWACGAASVLALAVLMGCAWQQTTYWRDSTTIWTRTLKCIPDNYEARTMLGSTLALKGHTDEAIAQFRTALEVMKSKKVQRVAPTYFQANFALGVAKASQGRVDEAIAYYREATVTSNPFYAEAQNNLGYTLLLRGEYYEGLEHLDEALKVRPDFPEAHYNRGLALHALGKLNGAIAEYREAIEKNPKFAEAHFNLAKVLNAYGRREEAIAHCRKALKIKPDFVEARKGLEQLQDAAHP